MRKTFSSNKGFAMTELLIVTVVILGIFALLFANFLPLMAEYENRDAYNNVTSKYAAFYLRKMYINALEDPISGIDRKAALNENIAKNHGYYIAYDKKENKLCPSLLAKDMTLCNNVLNEYDIEQVMITTYKTQDVKKNYPKNSTFSGYLNSLPFYKTKENEGNELYRIIIKTREYGYANTQILSDYKTNSKCFEGQILKSGELELTNYLYDGKGCSDKIILLNENITIKDKSGNDISGVVTSIGKNTFKDKNITEFSYPATVKVIKEGAFKNTKLKNFKFNTTLELVGEEAFSNTDISEITIPNYVYFDDYAFSNNKNLTSITLEAGIKNVMTSKNLMTKGLFKNCGDKKSVILNLPSSMEYIGEEMFNDTYVSNMDFGNKFLKGIESNAFKVEQSNSVKSLSLPNTLISIGDYAFSGNKINIVVIPKKVQKIGSYAFYNSGIKTLTLNSDTSLTIRTGAFSNNDIETLDLDKTVYLGSHAFKNNSRLKAVTIASTLNKIGNGSFADCPLLGEKQGQIKSYKDGISWCKVLYDDDNCKITGTGTIKIENNNQVKYVSVEGVGDYLD